MNEKERAMLEWCIRLTYSGMTVAMIRYQMLKKHEELLFDSRDADPNLVVKVGLKEEANES